MPPSPSASRSLLRSLLREGARYPDYNIAAYILRKARADFREGASLAAGSAAAAAALAEGQAALELVRRQSVIAGFYRADASVMESAEAAGGRPGAAAAGVRGLR